MRDRPSSARIQLAATILMAIFPTCFTVSYLKASYFSNSVCTTASTDPDYKPVLIRVQSACQAIPTFMPGDTKVSYSNVFCDSTTKQAGYLKYVSTTSGGVNRDCKTSANGSEFTFYNTTTILPVTKTTVDPSNSSNYITNVTLETPTANKILACDTILDTNCAATNNKIGVCSLFARFGSTSVWSKYECVDEPETTTPPPSSASTTTPTGPPTYQGTTVVSTTQTASVVASAEIGTGILLTPGSFAASVLISVTVAPFTIGNSKIAASAVSRSNTMKLDFNEPAYKTLEISMKVAATRRAIALGNSVFTHWLNKTSNEWLIICSTGRFYNATAGTLKTNVTNVTLNDKSFNPTKEGTGCAASYTGGCDGSGGELTVFELPSTTCDPPTTTPVSRALSDGAIGGIVIASIFLASVVVILVVWLICKAQLAAEIAHQEGDKYASGGGGHRGSVLKTGSPSKTGEGTSNDLHPRHVSFKDNGSPVTYHASPSQGPSLFNTYEFAQASANLGFPWLQQPLPMPQQPFPMPQQPILSSAPPYPPGPPPPNSSSSGLYNIIDASTSGPMSVPPAAAPGVYRNGTSTIGVGASPPPMFTSQPSAPASGSVPPMSQGQFM